MAKTDKMMRYYQAGIDYAHDLIRDKGLEAFEEDWRFRHKTNIITRLPVRVIDTGIEDIKRATFYTVLCMALNVLHDEFDFGPTRLKRYMDRFWLKTDCLEGGLCTWADLADVLLRECGIDSGIKDRLDEKGNAI